MSTGSNVSQAGSPQLRMIVLHIFIGILHTYNSIADVYSIYSVQVYTKAPRPPTLMRAIFCSGLIVTAGKGLVPFAAGAGKNPIPIR